MKKTTIALLIAIIIVPFGARAETGSVTLNRDTLLQLIASLQKQIALLSSQLVQQSAVNDRCPNITGAQSKVPEGLIYSRTYEKCVTEKELDKLDAKAAKGNVCTQSKDGVTKLREEYTSIDDKIEEIKKAIPKASKDTSALLKKEDVSAFISWIDQHYVPTGDWEKKKFGYTSNLPNIGLFDASPIGTKIKCREGGSCEYSSDLIQMALKVTILEDKQKEINSQIQKAEIKADKACN